MKAFSNVCTLQLNCDDANESTIPPRDQISDNQIPENLDNESETYGIADAAPWSVSTLCGIQHFLAVIGSTISVPHILFTAYCIDQDNSVTAICASSLYFVCGIVTILQSAVGTRLPVMHGTSYSYLIPILIVLERPQWRCPDIFETDVNNITQVEEAAWTFKTGVNNITQIEEESWSKRIKLVQGAMIVASLFEILLSSTGMVTLLMRFITPLVCTPVVTLVGLALMHEALDYASGNWGVSFLTSFLLIIFSEHFRQFKLPIPRYSKTGGFKLKRGVFLFRLFPVFLAISLVWILCLILTVYNIFPVGDNARTDLNNDVLNLAPWFRVPYPLQWGFPTFNIVCTVGMMGATLNKIITTIGNFYASARISEVPPPPIYIVNRGIFVQGIGNLLDGLIGIGTGVSSNIENAVIINMTKVASRRMMYVAGSLLIFIGVCTKIGAVVMAIPDPIIGGVLVVLCSSIVTMGLSNLKYVDLNSSRNLLTVGIPIFCGLAVPSWLDRHKDFISTGNETLDGILKVLLSTSTFVGFVVGILLDNLIPGTPDQRGLVKWLDYAKQYEHRKNIYELPFNISCCFKCSLWKFIPILPQYASAQCCCLKPSYIDRATNVVYK